MPLRVVVVAGPERSGKMPLARRLMQEDPTLGLVHRDFIRTSLEADFDEGHVTYIMDAIARRLLSLKRSPIIVAWNLHDMDRRLWTALSADFGVPLEWLDVREPEIAALIPPMEA